MIYAFDMIALILIDIAKIRIMILKSCPEKSKVDVLKSPKSESFSH